ncbi:protocadherin Fat 4-like [Oopsacas minuta]|uniref:Protocadherin Fat 4-like n=1 Tax=Oopsacas minuta TaxID=111878 RepID=A0AAV7JAU3_9METZ|nr:protocadherin Fat 4-like [Oopsacas minuta]
MRWIILFTALLVCTTICWSRHKSGKPTSLGKNKNYPDRDAVDECGRIQIQIKRNTGPFKRLIKYFTNSQQFIATPDQSYVTSRLKLVIDRLLQAINSEDAIDIIQGWSEDIDLDDRLSLRYEARSIRFKYRSNNVANRLRDLAGYAIEAGCDWVRNEEDDYITCCVRPDDCRVPIDLTFMLDTSGSVGRRNHEQALKFIYDVVGYFNIGYNATQVALIPFATYVHSYFFFSSFTDKASLQARILSIPYSRGWTNTWKGLYVAEYYVYTQTYGVRPILSGVPRVVIILTDGKSNGRDPLPYAESLKDADVTVFSVGIGSGIDEEELRQFASDPVDDHVILIDSYPDIEDFVNRLSAYTCTEPGPTDPGNITEVEIPEDDFRYFQAMCSSYNHSNTTITIEETDVNGTCSLYVSTDPDNKNPGPLTSTITTYSNTSNVVVKHITLPSGINTTLIYISLQGTGTTMNACTVTIYDTLFNQTSYDFAIPEEVYNDHVLGTLTAEFRSGDFDYYYSIIQEKDYNFFSIDSETGRLAVSGTFDFEDRNMYQASILVEDPRIGCLKGRTTVNLLITDINDNRPIFAQELYTENISENVHIDYEVITVSAIDKDTGTNAELVYSFEDPNHNTDFAISSEGVVTVSEYLDGYLMPYYEYTFVATDGGQPVMSGTATLRININRVNSQPIFIECSTDDCELEIPENSLDGDDFLNLDYFLTAMDPDTGGPDAELTWTGGSALFEIDSETGELILTGDLDRETQASYSLEFIVSDGGNPSLSAAVTVTVIVTDVNDNRPEFEQDIYSNVIAENLGPIDIFRVVATDMDEGYNAEITYSLGGNAQYFSINDDGVVSTTQQFDFENLPSNLIDFNIIATDGNFIEEVLGLLTITDVNDNSPSITGISTVTLPENTTLNTVVFNLTITDADSEENGEVTVVIVDGNQAGSFLLEHNDTNAIIILERNLDFEVSRSHILRLRATDGGDPARITSLDLHVTVLDINDNTPMCSPEITNTLREDVPINTQVGQVQATDGDGPNSPNSQISYSITAVNSHTYTNLVELFSISSDGLVTTNGALDIESSPQYNITVTASDNGDLMLSCRVYIILTLEDVNEFPPVINTTASTLNVTVREDAPDGTLIATVIATDADFTSGGIIYELTNPNFGINPENGEIRVTGSLDFETTPSYQLIVVVTDGFNEGTAVIAVEVLNINDITPTINIETPLPVSEGLLVDSNITCFDIMDGDGEANGIFSVSFSGAGSSLLNYNTNTSCITLAEELDREGDLGDNLVVSLTVNDNGEPNLHSTTAFVLEITDINDNNPTFSGPLLSSSVSENSDIGTAVFSAVATDIDAGDNARIVYQLNSTQFSININGLISVNDVIDFETTVTIVLLVTASDLGGPSLSGTVTVVVEVIDANDNVPVLTNLPFTVNIPENGDGVEYIFSVTSFDLDTDLESQNPEYFIIESSPNNTPDFYFEGYHILANTSVFDREAIPLYSLTISVSDGSFSATSTLTINITDVNDNAPMFLGELSFPIKECEHDCFNVFTIETFDTDESGTINAVLSTVDIFNTNSFVAEILDTNTINISCVPNAVDFETAPTESFILQATDGGDPPLSINVTIQVEVLDCNDNMPVFSQSYIEIPLYEDVPVNSVITAFAATDVDTGLAGLVSYRQVNLDNLFFTINATTGEVTLIRSLDFESSRNHIFYVIAFDSGSPSLSAESYLQVNVTNVNDNLPAFDFDPYELSLPENEELGFIYSDIMATDDDGDTIVFFIQGNTPFTVEDEHSSNLTLTSELDFEDQYFHSFTIFAKNPNSTASVSAVINLYVLDVNDNSPVITNEIFEFSIPEDTASGTFVFTATAKDSDSGENRMFHFFFHEYISEFEITPDGVVTTNATFDREDIYSYMLSITVQDMGEPTMSSTQYFMIIITDVNDNTPQFDSNEYRDYISESAQPGTQLQVIIVSDSDSEENAEVDLTDDSSVFNVTESGSVILVSPLDFESRSDYTFTVTATDRGNPSLSNTVNYTVIVENENDNPPVFSSPIFQLNIQEYNQLTNTHESLGVIFIAEATDADDNMLYYSYEVLNGINVFSINSISGELFASYEVDREAYDQFVINITATDGLFNTSALLYLIVTDVNDNFPYFISPNMNRSVSEATQLEAIIASIEVVDRDIGLNGSVELSIEQTDPNTESSVLAISQDGQIVLTSVLDFETTKEYSFRITATDMGPTPLSNTTTFTLRVSDVNDNTPVFTMANYSVTIEENTIPNLMCVSATDADSGVNAHLSFFILQEQSELESAFAFSGCNLMVVESFDFEQIQTFTILLGVRDAGTPSLNSSVLVYVQITDVNDNEPLFIGDYPDPLLVSENTAIDTVILSVQASDLDSGLNGKITFTLYENFNEKFGITVDGNLTVLEILDFETTESYSLSIIGTDMGDFPLSTFLNLTVQVVNENDNNPMFNQSYYEFYIPENSPIDTLIGQTPATDGDSGSFGDLIYSIVNDPNIAIYYTNTSTELSTLIQLDREVIPSYSLQVQVQDGGDPPLFDSADVTITLLDVNDNTPTFDDDIIIVTILENVPVNSIVVELHATDNDQPDTLNSQITFSINDTTFYLDPDYPSGTVIIRTYTILDREVQSVYFIQVTATDSGSPPLSSTANITVILGDIDDNAPMFTDTFANITLPESTAVDTLVATFSASDSDISSTIIYTIHPFDTFYINSSGSVFLGTSLDFETTQFYNLTINATDDRANSSATLLVFVTDVNEYVPYFLQNYTAMVYENLDPGAFVVTVEANDSDASSLLVYSISGDRADQFQIDISGEVTTGEILDREDPRGHIIFLTLEVSDSGSPTLAGFASLTIEVRDVNDNIPELINFPSSLTLPENTPINNTLVHIQAIDADTGVNADISYSLLMDFDIFNLTSTGQLQLINSLDFETTTSYTLQVIATDGGTPALDTNSYIQIPVTDVNDNSPAFQNEKFLADVVEHSSIGDIIFRALATDADSGIYSQLTYSLSTNPYLTINTTTGDVTVDGVIDREVFDLINVTVAVCDGGIPARCVDEQLIVPVIDINDQNPEFIPNMVTIEISEGHSGLIHQGIAIDNDDPGTNNSEIVSYTISPASSGFTVNGVGQVFPPDLDFETRVGYQLQITAIDGGEPSLNGSYTLMVSVTDINDNPPVITIEPEELIVPEDQSPSLLNVSISATDRDSGVNGDVTFKLIEEDTPFSLTSEGKLFLDGSLDYDTGVQSYTLTVLAIDGGYPSLNSTATLVIIVGEVNDNYPVFNQSHYDVSIFEEQTPPYFVFAVNATDSDFDSEVSYSLSDYSSFGIVNNGTIYGIVQINFESETSITFAVIATDNGIPPRSTEVPVTVTIIDINDNTPQFEIEDAKINVSESVSTPYVLLNLLAFDDDSGLNGEVFFTIDNETSIFSLTHEDGTADLILLESLDFEVLTYYSLLVTVHDRGDPELNSTITLGICVINENDNSPIFNQTEYSGSVREDEGINHVVVIVKANDADSGILGMIDYIISVNNFFSINQQGQVLVTNSLDADTISSIQLTVTACDGGSSPRCASVPINISLSDVNDNAPEIHFPPNGELFEIPESATVGTEIVYIYVTDQDRTTPNNLLTSSILSASNNGYGFFTIDDLGTLRLSNPVDFEALTILTFDVTILVSDGGSPSLNSTVSIKIEIIDINDNPPVITNGPMTVYLEENQVSYPSVEYTATDADSDLNARFHFSISDTSLTSINQDTGVVTFNGPFDFEVTIQYNFTITVTDQGIPTLSSSTFLIINILDANDNRPAFNMSTYEVTIPESTDVEENFITVLATDADGTDNNSIITYSIMPEYENYFQIDNEGGIALVHNLDFETLMSHTIDFHVLATDNGDPLLSSSSIVIITVTDSNDNYPQIVQPVNPSILEGTSVNTVLTTIQATDADSGINAVLSFFITNTVPFSIDQNNGSIIVTDTLDREMQDFYSITIRVQDNGTTSLSSEVIINVTVLDRNDNVPVFIDAPYEFFVQENASNSTLVEIIDVTDDDINENAYITCQLSDNDSPFYLSSDYLIARERLLTYGELDREIQSVYSLTITCQDISSSPLISTADIIIRITDINDNIPQFPDSEYIFQIREDVNPETVIGTIQATDLDEPNTPNSQLVFYITEGNEDNYFSITTDGVLLTNNTGRIPVTDFTLTITATDLGSPPLSNSILVYITIIDVNDEAPTFNTTDVGVIRISEYTPVGQNIVNFTAIDLEGSEITYSLITEMGREGDFIVDSITGGIIVSQPLDFERDTQYTLKLIAVDSPDEGEGDARTGMVSIPVFIIDENDNSPIFNPDTYEANITENDVGPFVLRTVSATDLDSEGNGMVTYSLVPPEALSGLISINSTTGIVSLVVGVSFDFEGSLSNEFVIPVRAADGGNPSNTDSGVTSLTIYIIDVNDNTPQIDPFYSALILENVTADTYVTVIQATDLDTDLNGEIVYSIDPSVYVPFRIDSVTGEIVSTEVLDREDISSYSFVVTASDRGIPVRSNSTIVNVTVEDINDNCPTIVSEENILSIFEESSGEVLDSIIQVVDRDIGLNGEYNYTLPDAFHRTLFSINSETGQLFLLQQLDRETTDQYNLTIHITDRGDIPCTATTFIIIDVQDTNDNRASFIGEPYIMSISEGVPVDTPLICVNASDPDLGENGEFTFQLVGDIPFTIDPITGCIVTSGEIDRETNPEFFLEVRAVANDNQFSTSSVEVIVIDGNDNTPTFTEDPYIFNVADPTIVSPIGTLIVIDEDEGVNGELFYDYNLLQSNNTQLMYMFNVTDNGNPILSSTTDVIIKFSYCEYLAISLGGTNNEIDIFIDTLCSATVELISTFTVLNSSITLNCIVVGNLPFFVQWSKDGTTIQEPTSITMLVIESLSIVDEGQYTCQAILADLSLSIQSEPYSLVVQIPPEITIPPKDLAINNGDTLILSCYSIGVPDPDHYWRLSTLAEPLIIDIGSQDAPEFNVTKNQISLPAITNEYEGYYSCNASNAVGYDEKSGLIIIHSVTDVVTIGFNNNFSNPDPNNGGCNNLETSILENILSGITGTSTTIASSSGDSNLCDTSGGTTITTTTTTTMCNPNPCNGYQCTLDDFVGFICECPATLLGVTCNMDNDECSGLGICQNEGVCMNSYNGFSCVCQSGFTGETCEIPISCEVNSCPDSEMCVDTVDGFDCLITQNVTVNTTNEQSANNVAATVNDEQTENIEINRRRRQTVAFPQLAYRNCVVIVSRETGSTVVTLIIGCLQKFTLTEADLSEVCQYLYDSYANFQSCTTPMGNVLLGPKTPPSFGVTISVILTNPSSGEVIPGTTAVELIVNGIKDASNDDNLSNQLVELGFPEPDLTQITATSLPPIPIEYTGVVIGILSILFILLVIIITCICLVVCLKRRSKNDKVTSYEHSGVTDHIEPKPKPTDLELGPSTELRDISTEPENEYGIMEQAVAITTFNNAIAEEPEVEVQAKPTLASKFSFQKKTTPSEEKVSLVPTELTETTEAINVVAANIPSKKPEVGKSDSLPRKILTATASFDDTEDIESNPEPVPENLPEKLPKKLPPKKKSLEPQSPTINEREMIAGALVPVAERDTDYKEDQSDVYSNVNVKPDATMAELWETAIKDGEKQDKELVAGKKLISVQSQELKVKQPISEPSSPPAQPPTTDNIESVTVEPVQSAIDPIIPIASDQPTNDIVAPTKSTQATNQPSSPQKIEHSLTYPWYYSDINREAAEIKLMQMGEEGGFLVRAASSAKGDYSLSVLVSYQEPLIKHLLIRDIGTELVLQAQGAKTNFPHLAALVAYYSMEEFVFADLQKSIKLTHPILK